MGKRWEPRGTVQVRGRIEPPPVVTIDPRQSLVWKYQEVIADGTVTIDYNSVRRNSESRRVRASHQCERRAALQR